MKWLSNVDVEAQAIEFKKKKRILIYNAFSDFQAEELYSALKDLTDGCLWYQSQRGDLHFNRCGRGVSEYDFRYRFDKFPISHITLKSLVGLRGDSRRIGYEDVLPHSDYPEKELPDLHPLRLLGKFLNSDIALDPIRKITGLKIPKNRTICFASRYMDGDFLTLHDDEGYDSMRAITFVLNMSKDWQHHWGGQTVFFEDESDSVGETYTPKFNTLMIFEVPMLHCVLPVSPYHCGSRLAISGWFQK